MTDILDKLKYNLFPMLVAVFLFGPFVWLAMDRSIPYEIYDGYTIPDVVRPGSVYIITNTIKNNPEKQCPGTVYWQFTDSRGTIFIEKPKPSAYGFIDETRPSAPIVGYYHLMPKEAAVGPGVITVTVDLHCNLTQYFFPLVVKFPPIRVVVGDE